MKKLLSTMLFVLFALAGQAQEIKMNETTISDYLPLLKAKGYVPFSFDVSTIKGKDVTIHIREFVNGKEVEDSPRLLFPYRFPTNGDKLVIGFLPSETDSLAQYCLNWENTVSWTCSLKLCPIYWESEKKYVYSYVARPFELTSPFEKDTFIPFVFYSSHWYDAKEKVTRCCGENFINPDLSSNVALKSPHYYIIGIRFY